MISRHCSLTVKASRRDIIFYSVNSILVFIHIKCLPLQKNCLKRNEMIKIKEKIYLVVILI